MKTLKILLVVLFFILAGAAGANALWDTQKTVEDQPEVIQTTDHGAHVCTKTEHCYEGYKCCSGHCEYVDTCP